MSDPLFGKRSIGIGGAVLATDVDMLFESLVGIIANGIAELAIPRDIRVLPALPVLGTGKLDYVTMQALVEQAPQAASSGEDENLALV